MSTPDDISDSIFALRQTRGLSVAKQMEILATVNLEQLSRDSFVDWPKVIHQRKQYLPDSWVARKRSRNSWISDHRHFIVELTNVSTTGTIFWYCSYCDKLFKAIATTGATI